MKLLILILFSALAPFVWADWTLDSSGSHIGFATTKNELVAENHQFTQITGLVRENGHAEVMVSLASIETKVAIRNERMQVVLFEAAKFPELFVSSQLDLNPITTMPVGQTLLLEQDFLIQLHGIELEKTLTIKVVRSSHDSFDVSSLGPIMIHTAQFGLSAGVESLRNLAGLQSIELMVPVTFDLRFTAKTTE